MPTTALLLALGAAALHAVWNLALAGREDPETANAVATATATLLFVPALFLGDVHRAAWPFIAASAALELAYFALLARGYALAELSVVYPLARGLAPVAVLALTATAASLAQAGGVVLVAAGVLLVRGLRRSRGGVGSTEPRKEGRAGFAGMSREDKGVGLGVLLALAIAGYTVVDKHGLGHADPLPYFELVLLLAAPPYVAAVALHRGPRRLAAAVRPAPVLMGIAMFAAYLLVLEALRRAAAAPVAAVRESSVVIAVALAAVVLREPVGPRRLAGAVLVAAGVAVVSVG
ncbi:MAG TPA: EamA family transporter [Gaiellaceae bacterium]|nr:EamA family transporter [Gaiellaceae bacterium]